MLSRKQDVAVLATLLYLCFTAAVLSAQTAKTQAPVVYEDQQDFRRLIVNTGDTFSALLQKIGLSYKEIFTISSALKPYFNANNVQPGQKIYYRLSGKRYPIIGELRVDLGKKEARYIASERVARMTGKAVIKVFSPKILTVGAMKKNRVAQMNFVEDLFSWCIEHDKGLQDDDDVMVYSEHFEDEYGQFVKGGPLRYLAVRTGGKTYEGYLFEGNYFDSQGTPLKLALFDLPLDINISISSRFGWRTHPLTLRKDFHPALDLRAPIGTPIYAAADGQVVEASFDRWLGKHVIIKHKGGFHSLYAHMADYAEGLKIGDQVAQKQQIGIVGDTGVTTGPHLHFGILKKKDPVDPRKYWTLAGVKPLTKQQKEEFLLVKASIDQEMLQQGISPGRFVSVKPAPSPANTPAVEQKDQKEEKQIIADQKKEIAEQKAETVQASKKEADNTSEIEVKEKKDDKENNKEAVENSQEGAILDQIS